MNTLRLLLATEWREQRTNLALATLMASIVAVVAALAFGDALVDQRIFAVVTLTAFGALAALVVGCDSFARDRADGSVAWILRMPFGLRTWACVKAGFLTTVVLAAAIAGLTLAAVLSLTLGQGRWIPGFGLADLSLLPPLVVFGLATAAASTFLPRGLLAVPGGIALANIAVAPLWMPLFFAEAGVTITIVVLTGLGLALGSVSTPIAAALADSRGGDRRPRKALTAVVVFCAAMSPAYGAAAIHIAERAHFTPDFDAPWISSAFALSGSETLLVNLSQRRALGGIDDERHFGLRIDLETGAVDDSDGFGRMFWPRSDADVLDGQLDGALLLATDLESWPPRRENALLELDATGRTISSLDESARPPDASLFDFPEGAWLAGRAGLGWSARAIDSSFRTRYLDAEGRPAIDRDELESIGVRYEARSSRAWLTSAGWLVELRHRDHDGDPVGPTFVERDGATGDWLPSVWSDRFDTVLTVLANGEALVLVAEDGTRRLARFDPEVGSLAAIAGLEDLRIPYDGRLYVGGTRELEPAQAGWLEVDGEPRLLIVDDATGDAPRGCVVEGPHPGASRIAGRLADGRWVLVGTRAIWTVGEHGSDLVRVYPAPEFERMETE